MPSGTCARSGDDGGTTDAAIDAPADAARDASLDAADAPTGG